MPAITPTPVLQCILPLGPPGFLYHWAFAHVSLVWKSSFFPSSPNSAHPNFSSAVVSFFQASLLFPPQVRSLLFYQVLRGSYIVHSRSFVQKLMGIHPLHRAEATAMFLHGNCRADSIVFTLQLHKQHLGCLLNTSPPGSDSVGRGLRLCIFTNTRPWG